MVMGYLDVNLIDSHLKKCWTTKYLYFGGKVFIVCPPPLRGGAYEKLKSLYKYYIYTKIITTI